MTREPSGDRELAYNLRRIVRERGITLGQVVTDSGLSPNTVSSMASGKRGATVRSLRRLRAGLGCTWDDLLGDGSRDER